MEELTFDLTGWDPDDEAIEMYDGPPPKPGVYTCIVENIEQTEAKSSGNPMLKIRYKVVDDEKFGGAALWDNIVLIDSVKWKLGEFLFAVGRADEQKKQGTINLESIHGTKVRLRVKTGSYNGEYQPRVGTVSRYDDGTPDAADVIDIDDSPEEPEEANTAPVDDEPRDLDEVAGELGWPTLDEVSEMKVDELKDLADDLDIDGYAKMRKAALKAACIEALEELLNEPF